jgi:dephospho-CoA kinase
MTNTDLQKLFSQAYILGGSPCSGKSTIAEMFSNQYDFPCYKADDHESEHMSRARPDSQPIMFQYSKMKWDEIWSR